MKSCDLDCQFELSNLMWRVCSGSNHGDPLILAIPKGLEGFQGRRYQQWDSRSASWRIIFRRCSFLLSPYSPYQSMHGCVTSTRLCYLIFATASLSIIGYTSLFEPFSSSATAFLNNSNPLWMLYSRLWMQTCSCSRHLEALHSWWDCKLKHPWIWYSLIFQYDEYNWV